ncbi:MAG: tripartite tricarboxylate transporter substrate binding protein [Burkholderiales bacterium]
MFKNKCLNCLMGCILSTSAAAQTQYPQRPIRMILPFAPGGAGDFVARILQPRMTELLGQQVIVDNRPGASGNLGVEVAANANADGYTILLSNIGAMAINPNLFKSFPVKPLRDFIAVSQVVDVPGAMVAHPSLPVKTVAELVAYLKARPGQVNFGSPGGGSQNRLEMEVFMKLTGTSMLHVPYKGGAGPAVIALLGNEVQVMCVTFSSALGHARNARLRMLGVIAPERLPVMTDMPTMREQGYKELTHGSWQGVYAPRGVPPAAIKKLFEVTRDTMKHPEVIKRMADGGVSIVISGSPDDFAQFNKSEQLRFERLIREAKIEVE